MDFDVLLPESGDWKIYHRWAYEIESLELSTNVVAAICAIVLKKVSQGSGFEHRSNIKGG